jgi:hypothetical protein
MTGEEAGSMGIEMIVLVRDGKWSRVIRVLVLTT